MGLEWEGSIQGGVVVRIWWQNRVREPGGQVQDQ